MIESSADTVVADVTLTAHVAAGVVALLAGIVAIVTRKGGGRHNKSGKAYVFSMVFVVVTAPVRTTVPRRNATTAENDHGGVARGRSKTRKRAGLDVVFSRSRLTHREVFRTNRNIRTDDVR